MSAREALLRALALKGSVPDDNLGAWSWKREGRSDKEKYEVRCRPPHHDRDPTEFTGSDVPSCTAPLAGTLTRRFQMGYQHPPKIHLGP